MRNDEAVATRGAVVVRGLRAEDMESVVALDARITGRRREAYFRKKLERALADTGIRVSLAAEEDGLFRGFALAQLYYGEFGVSEPVASLDTIGVHPEFRGRGIARALLAQLKRNLGAIGVSVLRTEVGWDDQELIRFLHAERFQPAARLCLDLDLRAAPLEDEGDPAREAAS